MSLDNILRWVAFEYGVDYQLCAYVGYKSGDGSEVRKYFCYVANKYFKFGVKEISTYLCCHHSNVSTSIATIAKKRMKNPRVNDFLNNLL